MRSDIEHVFADIGVMMKVTVDTLVESRLTIWTRTLQSQTVRAVKHTFEDHYGRVI